MHHSRFCSAFRSSSSLGILSGGALLCAIAVSAPAHATSGQNGLHDPSRMLPSNGKVYVYSTEGGSISSSDGLVWANTTRPPWHTSLLANNQGVWAPDGVFLNGQYYIYYAMWSSNKSSAVALLTTPSLDPASAKWTDQGVAVSGPVGVTHSVIDPCPMLDKDGNLWVTWGGGYPFNSAANSIFVTRMDNTTGLPLTTDPGWKPPDSPGYAIETGHKEGSYLYYHDNYYYLFWQTGGGFNPGTSYQINMARASVVSGPYSGDRVFYSKNPAPGIYGPGHMGIYSCGGVERFTYHFYSNDTNAGSALGENALSWGSDGWPVAGAVSTTALAPCVQGAVGPSGGAGAGGTAGGASGTDSGGQSSTGGDNSGVTASGGSDDTTPDSGSSTSGGDGNVTGVGGGSSDSTGGSTLGVSGTTGVAGTSTAAVGGTASTAPGNGSNSGSSDSSSCAVSVPDRKGSRGAALVALFLGIAFAGKRRSRRRAEASRG